MEQSMIHGSMAGHDGGGYSMYSPYLELALLYQFANHSLIKIADILLIDTFQLQMTRVFLWMLFEKSSPMFCR